MVEDLSEILTTLASPEEVASMDQFGADCSWVSTHHRELQEQYPRCWVAVCRGQVVATSKRNQMALIRQLRKKGLPLENMVVKFFYPKGEDPVRILQAAA